MLNQTLFRTPRTTGVHTLQRRGDAGAKEMSTHRVLLDTGGSAEVRIPGEEAVLVVQKGRARFTVLERHWEVQRDDVFTERATALYLPPDAPLQIHADAPFEAVIFSTPAPAGGTATLVGPDQVQVNDRGRANYSREVHNIFVD